jgi:hypothetical protein
MAIGLWCNGKPQFSSRFPQVVGRPYRLPKIFPWRKHRDLRKKRSRRRHRLACFGKRRAFDFFDTIRPPPAAVDSFIGNAWPDGALGILDGEDGVRHPFT